MRLSALSAKRQATIRPAFDRPREFVLLPVRAAAKKLRTDPATMVRIVRGLKFESYREFQHYLQELAIAHATSLDTQTTPTGRSSFSALLRMSLEQDVKNLDSLVQGINAQQVSELVKRLYSARRVVVVVRSVAQGA